MSIISLKALKDLQLNYEPLEQGDLHSLFAANMSPVKIIGKVTLPFEIDACILTHCFNCSAGIVPKLNFWS